MPASDSGERKATADKVPDWFAKLVIAVLGVIGAGLGGWALESTIALEKEQAKQSAELAAQKEAQGKFETRIEAMFEKLDKKVDRVVEKVGAKP